MDTTQLEQYIKSQLDSGVTKENIKITLLKQGWNESILDSSLNKFDQDSQSTTPTNNYWGFNLKNLKGSERILASLSFVFAIAMIASGGLLGGAMGGFGWFLSIKIIQKDNMSTVSKVFSIIGIYILAFILYLILAIVFMFALSMVTGDL